MPTTLGIATIAQSPRDDVVPAMRRYLPSGIEIVEAGCLDGLTRDEIEAMGPEPGDVGIVARLKEGGSTPLSHSKLLPRMQNVVNTLVNERHAESVVILCGADWSAIRSDRLIVNPGRLFPNVIEALAYGRKLGIIKPSAGQVESERARYRAKGIDVVVTAASPYEGEDRLRLAANAAEKLRDENCDLIWMTCIGMDSAMRDVVAEITGKPVILAHALLARITSELIESPQPVFA